MNNIIKIIIKSALPAGKVLILSFALLSCSSTPPPFLEIDSSVSQRDFRTAADTISRRQSGNRTLYNERNAISLFMDKGLLEHYAGNYAVSSADLQNAERLIEEAYTRSLTQGFFSFILNDNTRDYPGEDFENIYLNVFNALNYYNRGNIEGALVEIRKLSMPNGKLELLGRRHEYRDPNTGASLNEMTRRETGISQMPETRSVNFSNSALARYLSALFYQGINNTDSARIEFDQIQRAYSSNRNIYRNQIPQAVADARNVPAGTARLNVITFTGLSPVKEEQRIIHYLPFQHPILRVSNFKLPVLVRRPNTITRVEVIVEGHGRFDMELIEDMSAVIEETFRARYSSILLKTYIRTILKYVAADIAASETIKNQGELAGLAVALAARGLMDSSESADIRMSRYLPDKAYIGGINLNPGIYNVNINYYQGNRIISSEMRYDINVNSNGLNLLQTVNLK
ncbi:MAG: hypothetical protein FWD47_06085 [Treponema sp.]|nr:hypothetical protein [Treponema sp.]